MTARIVLLVTSPRLPAGLLTAAAWDLVRAHPVFAAAESEQAGRCARPACRYRGPDADAEALLDAAAEHGTVGLAGRPGRRRALARELGLRLAREPAWPSWS